MALRLDEIRVLADRVAASHGLDVVELEYQGAGKHRTLRVFIEKNETERAKLRQRVNELRTAARGDQKESERAEADEAFLAGLPSVENLEFLSGVTHEDCEVFSRDFGTVLEVEELAPETEYLLEISSPGLDRRLTQASEFRRFAGSLVKVQTFEPVLGSRHWQGRLAEMRGDTVVVEPVSGRKPAKKAKKGTAASPAPEAGLVEIGLKNVEKAHLVPEF